MGKDVTHAGKAPCRGCAAAATARNTVQRLRAARAFAQPAAHTDASADAAAGAGVSGHDFAGVSVRAPRDRPPVGGGGNG